MKRTKKEAEQTRQDIIDAGLKVFSKYGLEATRVEDIAKTAGVTRGAFYYNFTNKLELYAQLLKLRASYYRKAIEECFNPDLDPLSRLRSYMIDVFKMLGEDEKFRQVSEMIYFKSSKDDELKQITSTDEMQYLIPTRIFINTIDEAKEKKQIRTDGETDHMVISIFVYIQGVIAFSMFNKGKFEIGEYAEDLVDTFLNGLTKKK